QSAGLYLTTRGKALDNGAEGDVVSVLNLQSKRTVTGVVSGRGQVTIQVATPKPAEDVTSSITPDRQGAKVAANAGTAGPRDDNALRQKLSSSLQVTPQVADQAVSPPGQ